MKNIQRIILAVMLSLVWGCSPEYRLNRLLERHPGLRVADTLVISDTMVVAGVSKDTLFPLAALAAPVLIREGRLEVTLQTLRDTLYVHGACKPDTVHRILRVPVEKIRVVTPNRLDALIARVPWLAAALIALVGGIIFILLLVKQKNHIQ